MYKNNKLMFETKKPFNYLYCCTKKVNKKTFDDRYLRLKRNKYVIHCIKDFYCTLMCTFEIY